MCETNNHMQQEYRQRTVDTVWQGSP